MKRQERVEKGCFLYKKLSWMPRVIWPIPGLGVKGFGGPEIFMRDIPGSGRGNLSLHVSLLESSAVVQHFGWI